MRESLDHYKILDRIGAGGMGEVYRARDTRIGRTVAIKVLEREVSDSPARREPLLKQARACAALSHPNIATLFEVGQEQGLLYLVFEFVPGETLRRVVAGGALNPRRAVDFAIQLADALAEAHAHGIVHRDLKPDNVIVTPKGNTKILDFGLAAWTTGGAVRADVARAAAPEGTGAGAASARTRGPGMEQMTAVIRTMSYLSPEQALGEHVDHRTDVFSLGVMLFEMLTGKLPFAAATPAALPVQIVQAAAPAPSAINPAVASELDPIVAKTLTKSLEARYDSAATLAAELRAVAALLDTRSETAHPPVIASTPRPGRGGAAWLVAALFLAAVAALVWFALRV